MQEHLRQQHPPEMWLQLGRVGRRAYYAAKLQVAILLGHRHKLPVELVQLIAAKSMCACDAFETQVSVL